MLSVCLFVCLSVCEIQGYWAAYAAKKGCDGEVGVKKEKISKNSSPISSCQSTAWTATGQRPLVPITIQILICKLKHQDKLFSSSPFSFNLNVLDNAQIAPF